ncbi:MAG: hypothetical protein AB7F79_08450 [Steroidobacteraceae bacterium]
MKNMLAIVVGVLLVGTHGVADAKGLASQATGNPAAAWEGVWLGGSVGNGRVFDVHKPHSLLNAEYAAKLQDALRGQEAGRMLYSPQLNCIPTGMPDMMYEVYALEVLPVPGKVVMITEYMNMIRHIYTDGRPLPADPERSYAGTSVGHWEGEVLVVDTIGLAEDGVIVPGMPHSDAMRIQERIRLVDHNTLTDDITLIDPGALTGPWTVHFTYTRAKPDRVLAEYACAAGNRYHVNTDGTVITVPWAGE